MIELTGGDDGTAGTKGIWVQNDATLDIHGVTPATTWTRITSTVQVCARLGAVRGLMCVCVWGGCVNVRASVSLWARRHGTAN